MDLLKNFLENLKGDRAVKPAAPGKERPGFAWKRLLLLASQASFILFLLLLANRWLDLVGEIPGWLSWAVLALSVAGSALEGWLGWRDKGGKQPGDREGRRERVHDRMERKRREEEASDDLLTYGSDGYRNDEPR